MNQNQTNQNQKTALFVVLAGVALLLAIEPWQSTANLTAGSDAVTKLFPKFTDPFAAKSLHVIEYDQDNGTLRPFSVKQVDGQWVIPSHENYPADAREHMAAAATTLLGLESLNKVSSSKGEFEVFGVIDPDPKSLTLGTVGVGTRVTLKDGEDKALADLIVGKKVKDQPEQRYVRVADHDQVYVVKLNTDKLSTRFGDWIEKDLLKLNAFDIRQLQLNDYSIQETLDADGPSLGQHLRSKMKLAYDDEKSQWNLVDFIEYKKGMPSSAKLKDDEELNTEKLNGLKSAVDDLQIVDVKRKPKGLSRDLRASEDFVKDKEMIMSLASRGFFPVGTENGGFEILSSEGEVLCMMKDGVEYTLRFGQIASGTGDHEKADDAKEDKAKSSSHLNRYLFVTCKLHEDMIPKPQLEEVPGEPAAEEAGGKKAAEATGSDKPADEVKPGEPNKSDAPASPAPDAGKQETSPAPQKTAPPAAQQPAASPSAPKAPAPKAPAVKPPAGKQTAVEQNIFKLTAADETAGKKPAADDAAAADKVENPAADTGEKAAGDKQEKPADAAGEEAAGGKIRAKARDAKALAEKRAAVEKENQRKLDEYNDKLKKAQERTTELNDRFADWYYVISDEVYHKIHLSRADVVKKKEKAAGKGDGLDDFKALEKGGLPGHDHDHDHDHKPTKSK